MSKTLNELDINSIIKSKLKKKIDDFVQEYANLYGGTTDEYAPYGDTFARVGSYIDEETVDKARRAFEDEFDPVQFMKEMAEDENIQQKILEVAAAL